MYSYCIEPKEHGWKSDIFERNNGLKHISCIGFVAKYGNARHKAVIIGK
jgi:hypothetical protein